MKMWNDDSPPVDGYWFRSNPDAQRVEGMISFRQRRTWLKSEGSIEGVGEQWEDELRYYKGQNSEKYKGKTFCGSVLSLKGGGVPGRDLGIITNEKGNSTCCGPAPKVNQVGCAAKTTSGTIGWPLGALTAEGRLAIIFEWSNNSLGYPAELEGWTNILNIAADGLQPRMSLLIRKLDGTEGTVVGSVGPEGPGTGYVYVYDEQAVVTDQAGQHLEFTGTPQTPALDIINEGSIRLAILLNVQGGNPGANPGDPEIVTCNDGSLQGVRAVYRQELSIQTALPGAQWPGFLFRGGVVSVAIG